MNIEKIKKRLMSQGWRNVKYRQATVNNNYPGCGIFLHVRGVFRCKGHGIMQISNIAKWRLKTK